jgi:hypothetical protein
MSPTPVPEAPHLTHAAFCGSGRCCHAAIRARHDLASVASENVIGAGQSTSLRPRLQLAASFVSRSLNEAPPACGQR